jgi:predicted ATPase/class 3 adenylate cyclase
MATTNTFDNHSESDRRVVTVLFADLSQFTAVCESLDPEIVRSLQSDFFSEMTASVEHFGGYVDKFIGDAMLALFGAPIAHEDDPERALMAALDMVRRTDAVRRAFADASGARLKLHVGINTGPVIAGEIGSGSRVSYSVTGDTVNTAQRLQSLAAPGDILVGPLTHRLTRHAFAYESLGDMALRGRTGSVLVHRLTGPLDAPRPARGLEALGLGSPLIGRRAELARLCACLDLACTGSAQLVRVVGAAGVGKTRLVNEFIAYIRDDRRFDSLAIRTAACSPLGEQSHGTLAAILRSAYGISHMASETETRAKLAESLLELGLPSGEIDRLMPLYLHVLGLEDPDAAFRHLEPEQLRRQILFAVRTLFERRLSLSPLLIIVEDLHWADQASLEALRFVIDRLDRRPLMVLLTLRPTIATDQMDTARISRTALRLVSLSPEDGQKLLAAQLGEDWVRTSPKLCRRILGQTDGNPLFMEEIVRALLEQGIIERIDGKWKTVSDGDAADIPASIQAMLLSRIDRLPGWVRQLAQEAAIVGPQFPVGLLTATAGIPADRVEEAIEILCEAEIVEDVQGASELEMRSCRFTQSLLREVIYNNLLRRQRTEMHGKVAATLERISGGHPSRLEDLVMLGYHFAASAERKKGAFYLMEAGDRARASHANADAIRYYEQALDALSGEDADASDRNVLRERIGDLYGPAGSRDLAFRHYGEVLDAFRAADDHAGSARILRKIGRLLWDAGKRGEAETHYRDAGALLEEAEAPIERAHLLQELGRLACRTGDYSRAVELADTALRSVDMIGAEASAEIVIEAARAKAEAFNTKGVALARLGRSQEALGNVERSIEVAEQNGLLTAACRGYTNLSVLYTTADPARAMELCRRGLDIARRIGDLGFQARLLANLAVASCTFTDRCGQEGIPAAEEAIELDRALDQREHLAVPLTVLAQIHQCHGNPEAAALRYGEALEVALESDEPQLLYPCYDGLATLNLDMDRLPEAERYFALAQDVCAKHRLDPESLVVLPFLD